jgi:hypothetical protein
MTFLDGVVIKSYGEHPSISIGFLPSYPFISSGEKKNLAMGNMIKSENKFSHLWLYK